jgi:nicotinate dehydrogenase subunit B
MTTAFEKEVTRVDFLKGSGALVVALGLPLGLRTATADGAVAAGPIVDDELIDSWVAVGQNGRVTIFVGKVELGTGLQTAQAQIAAEELDVAVSKVDVIQGDTWRTPDQGTTSGSQSIKTQRSRGLRHGAAEARLALVTMAAARLGVPVAQLTVADGVVSVIGDSSRRVSYGDLIGGRRFDLKITGKAVPKSPSQYKVIGRSVRRIDMEHKVRSEEEYIQNVTVPGMLHGRVVRPPGINARLVSVNGFARRQPGLVKVVIQKDFVGVVAEREEQAIRAARELRVTWDDPGGVPTQEELWGQMEAEVGQARLAVLDGDVGTTTPTSCTARWARRARSPTSARTGSRCGRPRRACTRSGARWRGCSTTTS